MRAGSFTSSMNLKKMLDLNSCLSALNELKRNGNMHPQVREKLSDNIFASFSYGLWCIVHSDELYAQRKAIVSDLRSKIPPKEFFFSASVWQRILSMFFRYMPNLYIKIRSVF
jgi:hypothetical protein